MKKARFTVRCLVENLYKVTYKFRISGIVTTLFISRKVLQTRPQFCFAAILLFCIFAENKRFSYAKTGIDYGSHFGHRTRHGAPAGKGGIRRHRHGPPADRLATLRGQIEAAGGRCTTLAFDVRSEEEVRRNLSPLENIDLLVNNAGLAAGLEHIDLGDTRDWDAMIDTNVKGLLYVTRVIAPKMVAAGRGHIFNIGSIAGTEAYENGAVYCASKHAVHAISQSMRADLLSAGIKVTEIRPGMVETEFSEVRFHGDKKRADAVYDGVEPLTGADIAEAIAWAAQLPAHMNVNDMVLMPSQQAGAYYTHRKTKQTTL